MIINFIFIVIYLIMLIVIFRKSFKAKYLLLLIMIMKLWTILSTLYIETGVYISEQQRFSFQTGATYRLTIYMLGFIFMYYLIVNKKVGDDQVKFTSKPIKKQYYKIVIVIIAICLLMLFVNLFLTGIVILNSNGLTRFNFWQESKLSFAQSIAQYTFIYSFLLGYIFIWNEKEIGSKNIKRSTLMLIILIVIYNILQGHKFTNNFFTIFYFILPILIKYDSKVKIKKKYIVISIMVMMSFLLLKYFEFSVVLNKENPIQLIVERVLGLQGHVWWGTDLAINENWISVGVNLQNEFNEILNKNYLDYNTGMKYLMSIVSTEDRLAYFFANSINFTEAYPAILVVSFGFVKGFIVNLIMAILIALLSNIIVKSIIKNYIVCSILGIKIFIDFFVYISMGNASSLFSIKNLMYFSALIFLFYFNENLKIRLKIG